MQAVKERHCWLAPAQLDRNFVANATSAGSIESAEVFFGKTVTLGKIRKIYLTRADM